MKPGCHTGQIEAARGVRLGNPACVWRVAVGRVEARVTIFLAFQPVVAATVWAAVCGQEEVASLQDCLPEHFRSASAGRGEWERGAVEPCHDGSHREREKDSGAHLAEPKALRGREGLLRCEVGQ